jgi:hypothetical protein
VAHGGTRLLGQRLRIGRHRQSGHRLAPFPATASAEGAQFNGCPSSAASRPGLCTDASPQRPLSLDHQHREGVSDLLIRCQTAPPTSYRLLTRPRTPSCRRSGVAKPLGRRPHRCSRVRRCMGWLSLCWGGPAPREAAPPREAMRRGPTRRCKRAAGPRAPPNLGGLHRRWRAVVRTPSVHSWPGRCSRAGPHPRGGAGRLPSRPSASHGAAATTPRQRLRMPSRPRALRWRAVLAPRLRPLRAVRSRLLQAWFPGGGQPGHTRDARRRARPRAPPAARDAPGPHGTPGLESVAGLQALAQAAP